LALGTEFVEQTEWQLKKELLALISNTDS